MKQAVEEITDKLIGAVKTDKSFYTPKDLLSSGFPNFIVEQIRITINESLSRELNLPDSEWVEWENPLVQEAWDDLRNAVLSNSRVPKDKLYGIVQQVIQDILDIYLEPGKNLADYLYGDDAELTFEEMIDRTSQLTIQKHFGRAIPLYMQKRKLKSLERNRCQLLIQKLDANMVSSYTPEDWAGALQSLFFLCGGKIHSQLLYRFFNDKDLSEAAGKFKSADKKISKDELLNLLSGAELKPAQKEPEVKSPKPEKKLEATSTVDAKEQKLMDSFSDAYNSDEYADEGSINALFRNQSEKALFSDYGIEPESKTPEEKKKEESGRFHENLTSVLDMAAHSYRGVSGEEENEPEPKPEKDEPKEEKKKKVDKAEKDKEEPAEAAEESDEAVMWQSFLTKEHRETLRWKPSNEEEQDDGAVLLSEEDIFEETPPFSDVEIKKEPKKKEEDLRVFLMGQEVFLIEELFGGSEEKYQKALNDINKFNDWEKASDFIYSKLFSSNKIDMYSEAAVDFIDQLQAYFQEYKN